MTLFFRWICIYPAYLNSNKTRQEGRLLPKEKCVPNPNHMEIRDVLMTAGFQPIVEVRLLGITQCADGESNKIVSDKKKVVRA